MKYTRFNQYVSFKRVHCEFDSDIVITAYGYEDFTIRESKYYMHKMSDYTLQFIEFGEGTLNLDGHVFHLNKDEIFYLPKNVPLMYTHLVENPYKYYWISIDGDGFERILNQTMLSDNNPVFKVDHPEKMLELFKSLNPTEHITEIKLKSVFYTILDMISKPDADFYVENMTKSDQFKQIIKFIEHNYSQADLSIDSISSEFHMNSIELYRQFKKHLGISPKTHIINYRMQKAKRFLENGTNVSNTCNRCGFSDVYYFSKAFKTYYGYPPSALYKENPLDKNHI